MNALILGIGNVLLMDEGIGIRAVEKLQQGFNFPDEVEILDGGTSGIALLSYLRNKNHLIIIDAVKNGYPPGTVLRVEGADVPATFMTRISPHQIGLSDLLAAARLTGELPEYLVLFGIEPRRMEVGLGLSDEVHAGMDRLIEAVLQELTHLGYSVKRKSNRAALDRSIWDNP